MIHKKNENELPGCPLTRKMWVWSLKHHWCAAGCQIISHSSPSHSSCLTHIPVQRSDILIAGDILASLSDAVPEYQLCGAAVAVLIQVPDPCRGVSRPTATKCPNKDSYAKSTIAQILCALICSCRTQSTVRTGGNTNICEFTTMLNASVEFFNHLHKHDRLTSN